MKEAISDKILCDSIHNEGNDQPIITTIRRKAELAMSAITGVRKVVEKCRSNVV